MKLKECIDIKKAGSCGPDCSVFRRGNCPECLVTKIGKKTNDEKTVFSVTGTSDFCVICQMPTYNGEMKTKDDRWHFVTHLKHYCFKKREYAEDWAINWCLEKLTGEIINQK